VVDQCTLKEQWIREGSGSEGKKSLTPGNPVQERTGKGLAGGDMGGGKNVEGK